MKQSMKVLTSSLTNEWLTPPKYIEAAREVMGGIDLDPASNEVANRIVRATRYFTLEDDGLKTEWEGRCFLNPPYGKTGNSSNQSLWSRKALEEYAKGNISECVFLSKCTPGYAWWDWLFNDIQPTVCITRDRIAFVKPEWVQPDGSIVYPEKGDLRSKAASAFWYIGNDDRKFAKVFRKFGRIIPGICTRIH